MEKYIKVEDVIYGLQNIKKVKIGDIKRVSMLLKMLLSLFVKAG